MPARAPVTRRIRLMGQFQLDDVDSKGDVSVPDGFEAYRGPAGSPCSPSPDAADLSVAGVAKPFQRWSHDVVVPQRRHHLAGARHLNRLRRRQEAEQAGYQTLPGRARRFAGVDSRLRTMAPFTPQMKPEPFERHAGVYEHQLAEKVVASTGDWRPRARDFIYVAPPKESITGLLADALRKARYESISSHVRSGGKNVLNAAKAPDGRYVLTNKIPISVRGQERVRRQLEETSRYSAAPVPMGASASASELDLMGEAEGEADHEADGFDDDVVARPFTDHAAYSASASAAVAPQTPQPSTAPMAKTLPPSRWRPSTTEFAPPPGTARRGQLLRTPSTGALFPPREGRAQRFESHRVVSRMPANTPTDSYVITGALPLRMLAKLNLPEPEDGETDYRQRGHVKRGRGERMAARKLIRMPALAKAAVAAAKMQGILMGSSSAADGEGEGSGEGEGEGEAEGYGGFGGVDST